jgi:hypothetical protein
MFVPRVIPDDSYIFTLTNNGTFSYYDLDQNAKNSVDDINLVVIPHNKLIIHFPAWDYFYRDEFVSDNSKGFTLGKILSLTADVGRIACGESWVRDKSIFIPGTTFGEAANSVGEFAVCDIHIKDNEVYLHTEH